MGFPYTRCYKKNGDIRITGNYKPTLNPRIIIDEFPIPKPSDIFNKVKGAKIYAHLDVVDAYTHLLADEEYSHALTLNTPTHGLVRPTRAVYGAANVPAVWQRRLKEILQGLKNVDNFFDDILLWAETFEELLVILEACLVRLIENGIRLKRSKCVFATRFVEFLGHKLDAQGIHKSDAHIKAIRDAPKPTTPEEMELFIGKATYYNAFIPDLATIARPLRDMLLASPFQWTQAADRAYTELKNILISPQVLMPYDPSLPLILATDASKVGLGAVLSHELSNKIERPIAYASRTLTATEQRYPQIDKEALAIVWACQKFFNYLYARHFILYTDHKPLTQIFHPEKSLPVLCISRMANYADYLAHFNYEIKFKPTKANANADYCSRAPLPITHDAVHRITFQEGEEVEVTELDSFDTFIVNQINQFPVRAEQIAKETRKDSHLGKIIQLLETGQDLSRHGYKAPESAYSLSSNCLIFEHRVIIPPSLRQAILNDIHSAHLGIVKMKGLARSFVYWPGIDADIERLAKSCIECAKHAHAPPKFNTHHWEYPKSPWERIHIDYAGPVAGKMLLIIVDAYSKWLEVKVTSSSTSTATIGILDELFATYGVPTTVVSDNGRQFISDEFETFLKMSGVKYHKLTAPYHPSTNGQAEKCVGTTKNALLKMETTQGSLQRNLNEFLRQYRKAPHSTTGQPPALLFFKRNIRTRLDLVRPEPINTKITEKQQADFIYSFREFKPFQHIYFLSGNPRLDKWIPGIIITRLGDLHYEIKFNGKSYKRHIDQIRAFNKKSEELEESKKKSKQVTFFEDKIVTDSTTPLLETRNYCCSRRRTRFYKNHVTSNHMSRQREENSEEATPPSVLSTSQNTPQDEEVTPPPAILTSQNASQIPSTTQGTSFQEPTTSKSLPTSSTEISTTTLRVQPSTSEVHTQLSPTIIDSTQNQPNSSILQEEITSSAPVQHFINLPQEQSFYIPNTPPIRRSSRTRKQRIIYSPTR